MKPKWMPPLPDKFPGEVKQWMLDYAEQYRNAWVASLRPVATAVIKWDCDPAITMTYHIDAAVPVGTKLYRLDGGDDDAT